MIPEEFIKDRSKTARSFICTHWIEGGYVEPWEPPKILPPGINRIVGQLERGGQCNRLHYQFMVTVDESCGYKRVKELLGTTTTHVQPVNNKKAVENYVTKQDTRAGPPFDIQRTKTQQIIEPIKNFLSEADMQQYRDQIVKEVSQRPPWPVYPCLMKCVWKPHTCQHRIKPISSLTAMMIDEYNN